MVELIIFTLNVAKMARFEGLKKLKKTFSFWIFEKKHYLCDVKTMKQLALAHQKVICIPMSRNVVREHFESRDMFFRKYEG